MPEEAPVINAILSIMMDARYLGEPLFGATRPCRVNTGRVDFSRGPTSIFMNIDGRAWSVKRFISRSASGIESLAIEELAAPGPIGPGQVRVAMRAASINYRDLLYVSGTFGPAGAQGLVPCSDGAGEIIEVAG